jgi:hypothetical protein
MKFSGFEYQRREWPLLRGASEGSGVNSSLPFTR